MRSDGFGIGWMALGLGLALTACSLDRAPADLFPKKQGSLTGGDSGGASFAGTGGAGSGGMAGHSGSGGSSGSAGSNAGTAGIVPPPNDGCEPTGIFGIHATIDVAWGGRNTGLAYLTDNGRGRIVVDLRVQIDEVKPDGSFTAYARPCNVDLPAFYSTTVCEVYKPIFPHRIWDSAAMPVFSVEGRYSCQDPGCTMQLDPVTALIGVDLATPDAAWPTAAETYEVACAAGKGPACFDDDDDDQYRGISIQVSTVGLSPPNAFCPNGYPFRPPPLSANPSAIFDGVERAQDIYIGTRTRLGGSAVLGDDCVHGRGKGVAQGFESRAIGCGILAGTADWPAPPAVAGEQCTAAQETFMDENLPIYFVLSEGQAPDPKLDLPDKSVSTGPLFSMVRLGNLGDAVSCDAVRGATY